MMKTIVSAAFAVVAGIAALSGDSGNDVALADSGTRIGGYAAQDDATSAGTQGGYAEPTELNDPQRVRACIEHAQLRLSACIYSCGNESCRSQCRNQHAP